MKRSISNIGWQNEQDEAVYRLIKELGFSGLEIAPTRIFAENPYGDLGRAKSWAQDLKKVRGLTVSSMQSIWYGRQERLFGTPEERNCLLAYTKRAVDFAEAIGCHNLVFGSPKNRRLQEDKDIRTAVHFFREIGNYAAEHDTVIAMEANPPLYHTNFINTTEQAIALIREVDSAGFKLNLDIGTMLINRETIAVLKTAVDVVNHVHVSEPGLEPIEVREFHKEVAAFLRENDYRGYVSIEMVGRQTIEQIADVCNYVKAIFG